MGIELLTGSIFSFFSYNMPYITGRCEICDGIVMGSYSGICQDCKENLYELIKHIPKKYENDTKKYHEENKRRIEESM